jgi:hypothetical protein
MDIMGWKTPNPGIMFEIKRLREDLQAMRRCRCRET